MEDTFIPNTLFTQNYEEKNNSQEEFNRWIKENSESDYRNYNYFFTLTFRNNNNSRKSTNNSEFTANNNDDSRDWLLNRDWYRSSQRIGLQRVNKAIEYFEFRAQQFSSGYVIVSEEGGKTNRLHLHGLLAVIQEPIDWYEFMLVNFIRSWEKYFGFVKLEKIRDHDATRNYITKYMMKNVDSNTIKLYNELKLK